jgi:YidC/Oxa1 family membrane protein insertase
LFAIIFQLILFPLGLKQQKNMVKQAKLRPQEMAIRNKYKGRNDQKTMQKMQQELMELQQKNGYSPLSGCLPMLVQMIIIFPLYWVVIRPLQYCGGLSYSTCYRLAEIFGLEFGKTAEGINTQPVSTSFQVDLATKLSQDGWRETILNSGNLLDSDGTNVLEAVENMMARFGGDIPNATLFGFDLGVTPFDALRSAWWLLLIPIINLGLMYLSQFVSKKLNYQSVQQEAQNQANGSMKIMMLALPLMTFFVTANFASAIGIYWIFRTILSMGQQFILYKAMPYPTFTEEEYKQAEKDYKKGNLSSPSARQIPEREYRSLHHDDDDE